MWEPFTLAVPSFAERLGAGKEILPEDIDAGEMARWAVEQSRRAESVEQDFCFAAQPCMGHLWLEAMLGCPIRASGGTIWSEPACGASLETLASFSLDERNPWLYKLLRCQRALNEACPAVSLPVLHGPLDLLCAALGPEAVAIAFYDSPELLSEALMSMARLWGRVARRLAGEQKPFLGCYPGRMHELAPRPCATLQDDATWMTSPGFYREIVFPAELEAARALPCVCYHSHNTSLRVLEEISALPLCSLQITIDPNAPPWESQREVIARVQERVPVVLCFWEAALMERAARELRPEGLALALIADSPEGVLLPAL
jgi:hypothetical protein